MAKLFGLADRYIATRIIGAVIVILLAFTGLLVLFALLEEFEDRSGTYGYWQASLYVLYTLPRQVYTVLPYAVFLGSLVGLGNLASSGQLTAFRAAGMNPGRLFRGVFAAVALFTAFGLLLGERVAPDGEARATLAKTQARQGSLDVVLRRGYWYREDELFMSVDGLSRDGELRGVRQFWFDGNNRLLRSRYANSASYRPAASGRPGRWELRGVVESLIDDGRIETQRHERLDWPGSVTPELLSSSVLLEPGKLSISALALQVDYMRREGLEPGVYQIEFWSKLLQPLSVLALSLLALGFVLGPLRQVSLGTRLATGIFTGLGFKYLQDLFAPMTQVYGLPAPIAVLIPIALCALAAVTAIRRA
ncbi:MAG: LPS export ABC transporter permease LptG [Pseudomonadota bacterium]